MTDIPLENLPKDSVEFAYELGKPNCQGSLKQSPKDFCVSENLKFSLSGEGQHCCVLVEKQFLNTQDAVKVLATFFKVQERAVGYFGLKDKVALTQQWFSVDLGQSTFKSFEENDIPSFNSHSADLLKDILGFKNKNKADDKKGELENAAPLIDKKEFKDLSSIKMLEVSRNHKKFKIGQLAGNTFKITIRNISSQTLENQQAIKSDIEERLAHLAEQGFANYFGEQRFGRENQNIELLKKNITTDLNKRRALRARVISTLRSLIFNRYLSERIQDASIRNYKKGDVLQFPNSRSVFTDSSENKSASENQAQQSIEERVAKKDVFITGPMLGVDKSLAEEDSLAFEDGIARKFRTYLPVLENYQVQAARRALVAVPNELTWQWLRKSSSSGLDLEISFGLGAGSFATSLIRELVTYRN